MPESLIRLYLDFFAGYKLTSDYTDDSSVFVTSYQPVLVHRGPPKSIDDFNTREIPKRFYALGYPGWETSHLELDPEPTEYCYY